jgi:hypothetical protein
VISASTSVRPRPPSTTPASASCNAVRSDQASGRSLVRAERLRHQTMAQVDYLWVVSQALVRTLTLQRIQRVSACGSCRPSKPDAPTRPPGRPGLLVLRSRPRVPLRGCVTRFTVHAWACFPPHTIRGGFIQLTIIQNNCQAGDQLRTFHACTSAALRYVRKLLAVEELHHSVTRLPRCRRRNASALVPSARLGNGRLSERWPQRRL